MKISTRGRYGLRLMIELAMNQDKGYISLNEIAKIQEVSEKYLEQLITPLSKAGLVMSQRGAQGGYRLAMDADKISVGKILVALEGSLSPVDCLENGACTKVDSCVSVFLWQKIKDAIDNVINTMTLEDLVNEKNI
ncbi:MAG: Rrf2 family transcriptional regulator [Clostridiales bacterium]|nr:Rrf2 family transcriptional regulator [Clostridiales bacterium]